MIGWLHNFQNNAVVFKHSGMQFRGQQFQGLHTVQLILMQYIKIITQVHLRILREERKVLL